MYIPGFSRQGLEAAPGGKAKRIVIPGMRRDTCTAFGPLTSTW